VLVDRRVTLFVEPPAAAAATSTAQIFRAIDPAQPITLALPHLASSLAVSPVPFTAPRAGAPQLNLQCDRAPTSNDQYPSVAGQLNSQWTVARILAEDWANGRFQVMPSATGAWVFYAFVTPFVGFRSQQVQLQQGHDATVTVNIPLDPTTLNQVRLQFITQNGFFVTNQTVSFPSLLPDPDPLEIDTDANGDIYLNCVNASPIAVYVRTNGNWCYDGDVNLTSMFMQVVLQQCPMEPHP
jgi:hypothetical protein